MFKKTLLFLVTLTMIFTLALTGCADNDRVGFEPGKAIAKEDLKIGVVYISKINDQGWSQMHYEGIKKMIEELGLDEATHIKRREEISDADDSSKDVMIGLISEGCNVIIGTSYGYGTYMNELSKEYKDVIFLHCSGSFQNDLNLSNYFGRMYQARFLSGLAAGKKTKSGKIGYVAAQPIPEVIRGINAFTLGVRAVNPEATVKVLWTNSWYDPNVEKANAESLIADGCDVIAQHQDSPSAQIAADQKGVFGIGYNKDMSAAAPNASICAPSWDWSKYYTPQIKAILDGTWKPSSVWPGLKEGIVFLSPLTDKAEAGTQEIIDEYTNKIKDGTFDVFAGPIKDDKGAVKVQEGSKMTDAELLSFNWFVDGVIGTIPETK